MSSGCIGPRVANLFNFCEGIGGNTDREGEGPELLTTRKGLEKRGSLEKGGIEVSTKEVSDQKRSYLEKDSRSRSIMIDRSP